MRAQAIWNRRQVLQGMGGVAVMGSFGSLESAAAAMGAIAQRPRFAYVASMEGAGSIYVFAISPARWTAVQTIATPRPAALALHPGSRVLYVANEIDTWRGLPCGSIEAYAIDSENGHLTKLNEEPLSLSAIMPRSLAISPDGRHLVVAAYGGGAYNVLPLAGDGSLGRVASIVKEIGAGPHPEHQQSAHPHTVLFDQAGRYLLGTDTGADRLSVFQLEDGALQRADRASLPAGSGPGQMLLHPSGRVLFVASHLQATLTSFAYDPAAGMVGEPLHRETHEEGGVMSFAIHPSGRFLYASSDTQSARLHAPSSSMSVWTVDAATGAFSHFDQTPLPASSMAELTMARDGACLYALDSVRGEVLSLPVHPLSGRLGTAQPIVSVPGVRSMVFTYAEG